jgi:hypothetical protein
MEAKLTRKEKAAINRLRKLAEYWPKTLRLWSAAGSLLVVYDETGEVVSDDFWNIPNDGGDPGTHQVGDSEYLDYLDYWSVYRLRMPQSHGDTLHTREEPMTETCKELCPHCRLDDTSDRYHRVYPKRDEPHKGLPHCNTHGCVLVPKVRRAGG